MRDERSNALEDLEDLKMWLFRLLQAPRPHGVCEPSDAMHEKAAVIVVAIKDLVRSVNLEVETLRTER